MQCARSGRCLCRHSNAVLNARNVAVKRHRSIGHIVASAEPGDGSQTKGFGAPTPKPAPKSAKTSMQQYRSVLAAEEEAKALATPPPPASTSGRREEEQEETPVVVTDRMLQRIVIFAGIPVFVGFLLYPMFYYLKVVKDVDLPMGLVYVVQAFTFGMGLFGITYAVMSTSWDANRPGSFLGWTELQGNLPLLLERFKRK